MEACYSDCDPAQNRIADEMTLMFNELLTVGCSELAAIELMIIVALIEPEGTETLPGNDLRQIDESLPVMKVDDILLLDEGNDKIVRKKPGRTTYSN